MTARWIAVIAAWISTAAAVVGTAWAWGVEGKGTVLSLGLTLGLCAMIFSCTASASAAREVKEAQNG